MHPRQSEVNPISLLIVQDIQSKLEVSGLKISNYWPDAKNLLIKCPVIYLVTMKHHFLDKEKAKIFMDGALKDISDVINQPKYRIYLRTYPVEVNEIRMSITCLDGVSGEPLAPPYYSCLIFDKGTYRFEQQI